MEVIPGIHRIEAPLGERFVCMFLLVGDEHALLIDTGIDSTVRETLLPYLDSAGIAASKIRYVLNTHPDFDHTGGNGAVREMLPDAVFMCHELDRVMVEDVERMIGDRYCEFAVDHGIVDGDEVLNEVRAGARHVPIDVSVSGGEKLRLGRDWCVEVLHTPGHSYGHLSVWDPRSETLIIADATLYNAVLFKNGKPAFPPTYRYVDTYVGSMNRIREMRPKMLLTSHYPTYTGTGIDEFLGESRAYVDRVDQALADALKGADGARTLKQLIEVLGPTLGEWPGAASAYLCFPLVGHLERLVQYGTIETERRDGLLAYRWRD